MICVLKPVHYITKYYELADKVLAEALATDNPDNQTNFWEYTQFGAALALPEVNQKMEPVFENLEQSLLDTSYANQGNSIRYKRLVRTVGKQLQIINEKQMGNEPLTQKETQLIENNDARTVMSLALEETLHVLVDSREEFIPHNEQEEKPSKVITNAQKELNDLRIRTFATFPLNPSKDPMQQMKEELGM